MRKILYILSILVLTACQAPYERTIYQATGPKVCYEYYDSFRCSTPTQTWQETIYPKNNSVMQYGGTVYLPYQPMNLSNVVYGY